MKRLFTLLVTLCILLSMPFVAAEKQEVLELTMWCYGDDTYVGNPTEDVVLDAITRDTGVKITDIVYSTTEIGELQRFYMLYAAGEMPDIFLRDFNSQNTEIMQMMIEADMVYLLTDEQLETYCPDLMLLVDGIAWETRKTADGLNPYILNAAVYDNEYKRTTYPDFTQARLPYGDFDNVAFISRDDILTALCEDAYTQSEMDAYVAEHGELPFDVFDVERYASLESFFEYLYEVKATYPDVVPFTMVAEKSLDEFFEVFLGSKVAPVYDEAAMKVVSAPNDDREGFEKVLKLLNGAYRDGVLDSAFGIEKIEQQNTRWANGEYAVKFMQPSGRYQDINAGLKVAGQTYKYRYVPTAWMLTDRYQGIDNSAFRSGFVINKQTVAEEDIPKVLGYFNYFAKDETLRLLHWGPEELGLWAEDEDGSRHWLSQDFIDVVNATADVGVIKDFDYYGIIARRDPTYWKMSYWWYQSSGFDPYCYTVISSETQFGPASALSLISTDAGFYDSLFASWQKPVTDLTKTYSTYSDSLIDQLIKVVITTSDEAYDAALKAFYDYYYELGVDQVCQLYTEGYLSFIAPYADSLTFHPEADSSVLDNYK